MGQIGEPVRRIKPLRLPEFEPEPPAKRPEPKKEPAKKPEKEPVPV